MSKEEQKLNFTPDVLYIPGIVAFDKELQHLDKFVYAVIYWLERLKDGRCFASNRAIAKIVGSSSSGVANSLVRLRKRGYITIILNDNNQRKEIRTLVFNTVNPYSNEEGGVTRSSNRKSNTKKEYMSETLTDIKKAYAIYLTRFKMDYQTYDRADTEKRKSMLEAASKKYKLTEKRKEKIAARLADAGLDMVVQAIINASKDPWNHGDNDRGWKADLTDYILRNYEMVERWANAGKDI